ncbi:hypothetical protein [Paractinoplanes globisporus]|uniref:Methionine synthase n=1 Tax=Paractinoplanes globisporus TaxID=113565 RepID=A0ABW6W5Y1_9ACTN|nr:hypothetical protein [Actinoplanes globisporus]
MADDFQYHIDHHGGLVRPVELLTARASGDAGAIAAAEEEAAVATAHEQRRLTLSAVSDGQFRREHFESVVYDHVDGFETNAGFENGAGGHELADLAGIAPARRRSVRGPLAAKSRLADHEAEPLLRTVDRPVFVALPSPGYLALLSDPAGDPATVARIGDELAAIIRSEIGALAAQGVAHVALGNPLLVPLLTVDGRRRVPAADALLDAAVAADRAAVTGLDAPAHFRVGLDLTDHGPFATTEHGYDTGALEQLVAGTPFHRLGVDFPADPARRLPFDDIPAGIAVSFGIVDVSTPEPEPMDDLLALADEIADRRSLDDVAFAPNAGFAPSATAPLMTADEQRAKLQRVEMVCRYYWGNEI